MKKIFLVLSLLLLIGCENKTHKVQAIEYNIDVQSVEKEAEDHYYVANQMMPDYALLESYPSDLLMDYDPTTKEAYQAGDHLYFKFTDIEKLSSIEIVSDQLKQVKILIDGKSQVYEKDHIVLDVITGSLIIEVLENVEISEIRFIVEKKVDPKTYQDFSFRLQQINEILALDWSRHPSFNLSVVDKIDIPKETILSVSGPADLYRLKDHEAIGYPTLLKGHVVEIESDFIVIKSIIDNEEVRLYTQQNFLLEEIVEVCAIYIGYDNIMYFKDVQ